MPTPHLFRHSMAFRVYAATSDPIVVKEILGHSNLSQVPRYAALAPGKKEAAMGRVEV